MKLKHQDVRRVQYTQPYDLHFAIEHPNNNQYSKH